MRPSSISHTEVHQEEAKENNEALDRNQVKRKTNACRAVTSIFKEPPASCCISHLDQNTYHTTYTIYKAKEPIKSLGKPFSEEANATDLSKTCKTLNFSHFLYYLVQVTSSVDHRTKTVQSNNKGVSAQMSSSSGTDEY